MTPVSTAPFLPASQFTVCTSRFTCSRRELDFGSFRLRFGPFRLRLAPNGSVSGLSRVRFGGVGWGRGGVKVWGLDVGGKTCIGLVCVCVLHWTLPVRPSLDFALLDFFASCLLRAVSIVFTTTSLARSLLQRLTPHQLKTSWMLTSTLALQVKKAGNRLAFAMARMSLRRSRPTPSQKNLAPCQ